MGFIAAGIAAVGAGVSAYGTIKNASAIKKAAGKDAGAREALYDRQSENLDKVIGKKTRKLKNIGNIFDRINSAAFGDTDTLDKLRTAQQDYANLAAGDFTGFEESLRKTLSDSLINTFGSGAPIGTFAGIAADKQLEYREKGIEKATGIGAYISGEANNLINYEFGIMDQNFNTGYQLDSDRVNGVSAARMEAAKTQGVGMTAIGNAVQQVGGALTSYNTYKGTQASQAASLANSNRYMDILEKSYQSQSRPTVSPASAYIGGASEYPASSASNRSVGSGNFIEPDYSDVPLPTGPALYTDDVGLLPPLSYNSSKYSNLGILSSIGRKIVTT